MAVPEATGNVISDRLLTSDQTRSFGLDPSNHDPIARFPREVINMILSHLTREELSDLQLVSCAWNSCLFQFVVDTSVRRGALDLALLRPRVTAARIARVLKAATVKSVEMTGSIDGYMVLLRQSLSDGLYAKVGKNNVRQLVASITTELDNLTGLTVDNTFAELLDDWKYFGPSNTIVPNQLKSLTLPLALIQHFYEFLGGTPNFVLFPSVERLSFSSSTMPTTLDDKRWADFSPDCFKRKFVVLPSLQHLCILNDADTRASVNHRALDFIPMWMPNTETVTCFGLEIYCCRTDDITHDIAYRADFSSLAKLRSLKIVNCQLWLAPRLPATCKSLCLDGTMVRIAVRGRPRLNESYDAFEYNEPGAGTYYDLTEWQDKDVQEYQGLQDVSLCGNPWLVRFHLWFITSQCQVRLRRLDLYGTPLMFIGRPQAEDAPEYDLLRNLMARCPNLEYLGLGGQPTIQERHATNLIRLNNLKEVCLVRTAVKFAEMIRVLEAFNAAGRELQLLYYDGGPCLMTNDQYANLRARFPSIDIRRMF
ncbi:hypothetical protein V1505DRAFT_366592 [Lipomyces doorenjongii]